MKACGPDLLFATTHAIPRKLSPSWIDKVRTRTRGTFSHSRNGRTLLQESATRHNNARRAGVRRALARRASREQEV